MLLFIPVLQCSKSRIVNYVNWRNIAKTNIPTVNRQIAVLSASEKVNPIVCIRKIEAEDIERRSPLTERAIHDVDRLLG